MQRESERENERDDWKLVERTILQDDALTIRCIWRYRSDDTRALPHWDSKQGKCVNTLVRAVRCRKSETCRMLQNWEEEEEEGNKIKKTNDLRFNKWNYCTLQLVFFSVWILLDSYLSFFFSKPLFMFHSHCFILSVYLHLFGKRFKTLIFYFAHIFGCSQFCTFRLSPCPWVPPD